MDESETINFSIPANDLTVVTNIDDLVCMICMNICFKPVLITCCEKLMCHSCIKMMIKLSTIIKCPNCNNININFVKPSKIINRMFENLTLFCPNKFLGCGEKIKYYFYFEHVFNLCQVKKNYLTKKYCKNCMVLYCKNSSHLCNNLNNDDKRKNLSYLEQIINSLYDDSLQSQGCLLNNFGNELKVGNSEKMKLNDNTIPPRMILLPM